jgi:type IV pilus assembly protein PilA
MIINKKKKKKGFTLIELIAVIAILAILGAVLVPKISGYSLSAKQAKAIADAKIIVSAVSAYNLDQETAPTPNVVVSDATFSAVGVAATSYTRVNIATATGLAQPTEISDTYTFAKLQALSLLDKTAVTFSAGKVSN